MSIHTIHGASDNFAWRLLSCRNFISTDTLRSYLQNRPKRYLDIAEAGPNDDVLTVDDSTVGGAKACLLARETGHAVTYFVNPYQILSSQQYFFALLDVVLDSRIQERTTFDGVDFQLKHFWNVRSLRMHCRQKAMCLTPEDSLDLCLELGSRLGSTCTIPPDHACSIKLDMLRTLHASGVRIESHGWDHRDIRSLTPAAFAEDVRMTADWLETNISIRPSFYAVPFGFPAPTSEQAAALQGDFLLVDNARPTHWQGERGRNRIDITDALRESTL